MRLPCRQVDICGIAVAVRDGREIPVGVVVEFHLTEGVILQLAVNQHAAVRVKAAHDVLPRLDAQLVPAVTGEGIRGNLPCDGRACLIPVRAADCVVDHLHGVGRRNGVGIVVIAGVERRGGLVFCRLALHAVERGRSLVELCLRGRLIFRGALRLTEPDILDAEICLDAGQRDRMRAGGQRENQRVIEQTVLVVDEFRLPLGMLNLRRTHLIAAGIGLDVVFVDKNLVQADARCRLKRHIAVNGHGKLDQIGRRFHRVIADLHGIDAGFGDLRSKGDVTLRAVPDQHIVLFLIALAERPDGKCAVPAGSCIGTAQQHLCFGARLAGMGVVIVTVACFAFKVQLIERGILCTAGRGRIGSRSGTGYGESSSRSDADQHSNLTERCILSHGSISTFQTDAPVINGHPFQSSRFMRGV